jgi:hypothetical protein
VPDASFAAPTVTHNYDAEGRRTQMVDAGGTATYIVNGNTGRLAVKNAPQGSIVY